MRGALAVVTASLIAGCAGRFPTPPGSPVLIGPAAPELKEIRAVLAANPVPPDRPLRVAYLGRTETASYHLVQIRTREEPHLHADHDLVAHVLSGRGAIYLLSGTGKGGSAGVRRPMRKGDTVVIPRGTIHWFVNETTGISVALASFSPPLDGPDTVPRPGFSRAQALAEDLSAASPDCPVIGITGTIRETGKMEFTLTATGCR